MNDPWPLINALLEDEDWAQAERQLGLLLARYPVDDHARSLRVISLIELRRWREAEEEAGILVRAHDDAHAHWLMGQVLLGAGERRRAYDEAQRAVTLDNTNPEHFLLLMRAEFALGREEAAFNAIDRALALEPGHEIALRLRGMLLQHRGRTDEAEAVFQTVLQHNAHDAFAHAGQGWVALQRGDAAAMQHFRESLALSPDSEYAREGLIQALKARNPLYRVMLRYFLWMQRQGKRQWLYILGAIMLFRVLRETAEARPQLAWVIWPLIGLYVLFLLLSWIAEPLFDLLLRFDPVGRSVLTRERITASNWLLAGIVTLLVTGLGAALTADLRLALAALVFAVLLLPLSAVFHCAPGWPRQLMATLTMCIAGLGFTSVAVPGSGGQLLVAVAVVFAVLSTWLSRWLASVDPRRS